MQAFSGSAACRQQSSCGKSVPQQLPHQSSNTHTAPVPPVNALPCRVAPNSASVELTAAGKEFEAALFDSSESRSPVTMTLVAWCPTLAACLSTTVQVWYCAICPDFACAPACSELTPLRSASKTSGNCTEGSEAPTDQDGVWAAAASCRPGSSGSPVSSTSHLRSSSTTNSRASGMHGMDEADNQRTLCMSSTSTTRSWC